jgi:hypothetical protein
MEEELYDEFGNYIGPDINVNEGESEDSGSDAGSESSDGSRQQDGFAVSKSKFY